MIDLLTSLYKVSELSGQTMEMLYLKYMQGQGQLHQVWLEEVKTKVSFHISIMELKQFPDFM